MNNNTTFQNILTVGIISNVRETVLGKRSKIVEIAQSIADNGWLASRPVQLVTDVDTLTNQEGDDATPIASLLADYLSAWRSDRLSDTEAKEPKEPTLSLEVEGKTYHATMLDMSAWLRSQAMGGAVTAVPADGVGRCTSGVLLLAFYACARVDGTPALVDRTIDGVPFVEVDPADWRQVQIVEAMANDTAETLERLERARYALGELEAGRLTGESQLKSAGYNKGRRQDAWSTAWLVHHTGHDIVTIDKVTRAKRVTLRKDTEAHGAKTPGDRQEKRQAMFDFVQDFLDNDTGKKPKSLAAKVIGEALAAGVPACLVPVFDAFAKGDGGEFDRLCGLSMADYMGELTSDSDSDSDSE
jgi:hypothetical protein